MQSVYQLFVLIIICVVIYLFVLLTFSINAYYLVYHNYNGIFNYSISTQFIHLPSVFRIYLTLFTYSLRLPFLLCLRPWGVILLPSTKTKLINVNRIRLTTHFTWPNRVRKLKQVNDSIYSVHLCPKPSQGPKSVFTSHKALMSPVPAPHRYTQPSLTPTHRPSPLQYLTSPFHPYNHPLLTPSLYLSIYNNHTSCPYTHSCLTSPPRILPFPMHTLVHPFTFRNMNRSSIKIFHQLILPLYASSKRQSFHYKDYQRSNPFSISIFQTSILPL